MYSVGGVEVAALSLFGEGPAAPDAGRPSGPVSGTELHQL